MYYRSRSRKNRRTIKVVAGIVGLLFLAVFMILVFDNGSSNTDSGITACRDMAKRSSDSSKDTPKYSGTRVMTDTDYREVREPFEKSKYEDIRVAGTSFVDTTFNLNKAVNGDGQTLSLLELTALIRANWAELQAACKNHGVSNIGIS